MVVALRDVTPGDRRRLFEWRNLPEVARYMYTDREISWAEHEAWFDTMLADEDRRYWIIENDNAPLGVACLYPRYPEEGASAPVETHWAFYIADSAERGRGIGVAVEYLVLAHVFEELEIDTLYCEVLAENEPVVKLHKKVGFTECHYYHRHVRKSTGWSDVIAFRFDKADWPAARERLRPVLARRNLIA